MSRKAEYWDALTDNQKKSCDRWGRWLLAGEIILVFGILTTVIASKFYSLPRPIFWIMVAMVGIGGAIPFLFHLRFFLLGRRNRANSSTS
jgi:hypothetical protein